MLIETKYSPSQIVWLNRPIPTKGSIVSIIIRSNGHMQYNIKLDKMGSITVNEEEIYPTKEVAEVERR